MIVHLTDGERVDLRIPLISHPERALLIQLDEAGTLHFRYTLVPKPEVTEFTPKRIGAAQ